MLKKYHILLEAKYMKVIEKL